MRLTAWEDRLFHLPPGFHELRYKPLDTLLSTPWPEAAAGPGARGRIECRRMDDFPDDLLHSHGTMWQSALAYLALSRRERETWHQLPNVEKRRTEWLLARIAAKDAVRVLLRLHHGLELCLPDIEIESDPHGRPLVAGAWTTGVERVPSVSLAHTRHLGVAMLSADGRGCGIDVERVEEQRQGVEEVALTSGERELAEAALGSIGAEWAHRIWCAKEAVGKALGRGLPGGPRDLTLCALDVDNGTVEMEVTGKLAQELPDFAGSRLQAHTLCDGELVAATALLSRSA